MDFKIRIAQAAIVDFEAVVAWSWTHLGEVIAPVPDQDYCKGMAEVKKVDFNDLVPLTEEEDEETLAAIDRGIKAADEGRVVSSEEVRRRMQEWLTKSSSPKTH